MSQEPKWTCGTPLSGDARCGQPLRHDGPCAEGADVSESEEKPAIRVRPLPPVSKRFKPGQSGNPSGRPKDKGFRRECRRVAKELLAKIETNAGIPETLAGVSSLVKAFVEVSNRGGFRELPTQLEVEEVRGRLLVAALKLGLSKEQQDKLLAAFSEGE